MEQNTGKAAANIAGFVLLFFVAMQQSGALLLQWMVQQGDMSDFLVALCNLLVSFAILILPFLVLKRISAPIGYVLMTKKSKLPIYLLLPLFLGVMLAVNSISSMIQLLFSSVFGLPAVESASLPESIMGQILYFVSVCIIVPVMEEVFFRGGVQKILQPFGVGLSLIVTTVIFTLLHARVEDFLTVFLLGLVLGYVFQICKSVWPCVVLHFANNFVVFLMLLSQEILDSTVAFAVTVWTIVVCIALAFAAVWMIRIKHLGKYMFWRKEKNEPIKTRLEKLIKTPMFLLAVIAVVIQFGLHVFS